MTTSSTKHRAAARKPRRIAPPPRGPWGHVLLAAGVAFLVRLVYLFDAAEYPAFDLPIHDAFSYHAAALAWARGEPMSDQFFYQPFFYPLWLGLMYALNGGSVLGVKLAQIMLGAVNAGLTCVLGRRLLGGRVGLIAGLIVACYGPMVFYDAELLAAGWATFWALALLLLFTDAQAKPRAWLGPLLGAAGGLSVLTRPTFLPFFLIACAWLLVSLLRRAPTRRAGVLLAPGLMLGFAVIVLPVAARNARASGHFTFLPHSGGVNLYLGNHPDRTLIARTTGFDWDRLMQEPRYQGITDPYDVQRYFYAQTRAYVSRDPAAALLRLGEKSLAFLAAREIPRNFSMYFARRFSGLQTVLTWKVRNFGFPFGVLLPLAVVGALAAGRRLPAVYWLFVVLYPAAVIVVFVAARYRIPVIPALAILAAAGANALYEAGRARNMRRLAAGLCVAGVALLVSVLPGPFPLERGGRDEGALFYLGIGHAHRQLGQRERALAAYGQELDINPTNSSARAGAAQLLAELGQPGPALQQHRILVEQEPDAAVHRSNLGLALLAAGEVASAAEQLRAAVDLEPREGRYHSALGIALAELGDADGAIAAHDEAVRRSPASSEVHFNRGITLARLGRLAEAVASLRKAAELNPDDRRVQAVLQQAQRDLAAGGG